MIEIQAKAIGADALAVFRAGEPGEVIGQTSRGLFCSAGSQSILFLSLEEWRGPLTINLVESAGASKNSEANLLTVPVGSPVRFNPHGLRLIGAQPPVFIRVEKLPGWRVEKPLINNAQIMPALRRAETVASLARTLHGEVGWSALLTKISVTSDKDPHLSQEKEGVALVLHQFQQAWRADSLDEAVKLIGRLLGCGSGLTPSGDDLAVGLLLGLRWLEAGFSAEKIDLFCEQLTSLAREKTTTLGACLIASAARGQADEWLTSGLAGILNENLREIECASRLVSYGNSSGMDTLSGFFLALNLYCSLL